MTTSHPDEDSHPASMPTAASVDGERTDLLEALAARRHFLRFTARDLTDEQARQRTTASELTLGGLIKHVAAIEAGWAKFVLDGPAATATSPP